MALPKVHTPEELDVADYLDVKRTEVSLRARIWSRRKKNEIVAQAREAVLDGRLLRAKLPAGDEPQ
jgi:hypothetical protein